MSGLTPDQAERLMLKATARLAEQGLGEIDGARVHAALTTLLAVHRRGGTQVDRLVALGATCWGRPLPDDPSRCEFRLGWPADWPVKHRRGRSVRLGHLPMAELLRGGQG